MTRETILRKAYEMATHNLFCTSDNYAMTRAKEGQETQWAEYNAK